MSLGPVTLNFGILWFSGRNEQAIPKTDEYKIFSKSRTAKCKQPITADWINSEVADSLRKPENNNQEEHAGPIEKAHKKRTL